LYIGVYEYGSLFAEGTEKDPITFTSNSNSPSAGDWSGIVFGEHNSSSRSSLAYCTLEYAGEDEVGILSLDFTSIKLNNCTIQNAETYGIDLYESSFVSCENNKIWNCATFPISCGANGISSIGSTNEILADDNYGILVTFSDVDGNHTWYNFDAPYIIQSNIFFENSSSGSTLTLTPGTTIKFNSNTSMHFGSYNYGKLVANGTTEAPITFTSAAPYPSAGDWGSLDFGEKAMAGSILNNCIISYGSDGDYGMVNVEYTDNVTITNSDFSYSSGHGIYIYNSNVTMSGNTFSNISGSDVYDDTK